MPAQNATGSVLLKKGPLNEQQREKINQHPQRTVQMLRASGLGDNEWLENGEIAIVTARSEKDSLKCQVISTYEFETLPDLDIKKLFDAKSAAA